ncbi:hypothetical protein [Chryseobacterium cucumeris]|uniref:hypothetical protein n=1 Tax=Chryseobacterium TaxID=59732 RepID=UPI00192DD494|nr:hypothetical protein [Chryseobacterium cucumeris]QRA42294.1 hypothetical protein JNG87_16950 [Chryseobacterium cucumeris]
MKFKIFIVISILLVGVFFVKVFLSDFFISKNEVHIMDKYYVLEINGEYNLMHKEEHGYSLTIPSVLNVYIKSGEIIATSTLEGNKFINNNYKNQYSAYKGVYYYHVKRYKIQEINKEQFFKQKKMYSSVWQLK